MDVISSGFTGSFEKVHRKSSETEPATSIQPVETSLKSASSAAIGTPGALSGTKEKRRSSPRRHHKTHTLSQLQQITDSEQLNPVKLEWKKGDLIGKGSFGKVYMGMLVTGELIAVKQV
jgi:hypothetical protein